MDTKWRKRLWAGGVTLVSLGVLGGVYRTAAFVNTMHTHVLAYHPSEIKAALDEAQLDRIEKKVDTMNQVFFFMLSAPSEAEQRAWFREKANELGLVPTVIVPPVEE